MPQGFQQTGDQSVGFKFVMVVGWIVSVDLKPRTHLVNMFMKCGGKKALAQVGGTQPEGSLRCQVGQQTTYWQAWRTNDFKRCRCSASFAQGGSSSSTVPGKILVMLMLAAFGLGLIHGRALVGQP